MLTLKITFRVSLLIILSISAIFSMTYETKTINFNSVYLEELKGSQMKFYSVNLDSNIKESDLLIDARRTDSKDSLFESPKPLPNTDKSSQWVCGQLGIETCFIPNKYLSQASKVYIGVLCESCNFSLKTSYVKEEVLKDGENKLFHLKSGDSKVFTLDESFQSESEWIQIVSFNLRMTNFKMDVEIIEKDNLNKMINAPVITNWIGGKQATIKPNTSSAIRSKYIYRIILTATENGVFNIEARTSKSIIKLNDKTLKFESVKKGSDVCFSYTIKDEGNDSIVLDVKSIKGDVHLNIFPASGSKSGLDNLNLTVTNDDDLKYEITKDYRNSKNAQSGAWIICADGVEDNAFFTIQVYLMNNSHRVKEYKQLLYQLIRKEQMYDLENIQSTLPEIRKILNVPAFRTLLQSDASPTDLSSKNNNTTDNIINPLIIPSNNTSPSDNPSYLVSTDITTDPSNTYAYVSDPNEIKINGNGVAGIWIFFIFLIPVSIGSMALMSIFVNTKFLDSPLRIKIME